MKRSSRGLAAWAIGFAFVSGAAFGQPASESAFAEAVQLVQRASAGDDRAIDGAVAAFEALGRADPGQPLYAAYLGSATGMKARTVLMPWTKMKHGEQGLEHIDRALRALKPEHDRQLVRGAPVGVETRIVAARTFLRMPDNIFHRRAAGKRLVAEILRHPQFADTPAPLRAVAHLAAAEAARGERPDEELAQLKQVLALAPDGGAAGEARARLKELGQ